MFKKEIIYALLSLLVGLITITLPIFEITEINVVIPTVLLVFGLMNIISAILLKTDFSRLRLFKGICSIVIALVGIFLEYYNSNINIVLILLIWVIMMSLAKFKKCDYYHDRSNNLWKVNIFILAVFIVTSFICSINLLYIEGVEIMVMGFILYINGILEFIDPITNYIVECKNESSK